MNTLKKIVPLSIALLSAPCASLALAHTTASSSHVAMKTSYDVQFLDSMSKHHRDGIEMFQIATQKASMPAVKAKAQSMIDMQQAEVPKLQALRTSIDAKSPDAVNMKLPGMKPMNMSKLQSANGMMFDQEFLKMTIEHHQDGIMMARDALKHSKNAAVRSQAQTIIDEQTKDIADLKALQKGM